MEPRESFQQIVLELDIHVPKTEDTDLILFTKIASKWITDLSIKLKTIEIS